MIFQDGTSLYIRKQHKIRAFSGGPPLIAAPLRAYFRFIITQARNIEKQGCTAASFPFYMFIDLFTDVEACPPCVSRTGQSAPVCISLQTVRQDRLSRRYAMMIWLKKNVSKTAGPVPRKEPQDRHDRNGQIGAWEHRSLIRGIISLLPPPALQDCIEPSFLNRFFILNR